MQRITKHINPAMILALVALVFAVTGGAYAASGGGSSHATLTASAAKKKAKPKSTRGPAGPAGKNGTNGANGATGPAGPQGTAGPEGKSGSGGGGGAGATGSQGTTGSTGPTGLPGGPGTNGKSVTVNEISPGEPECSGEGGVKVEVENSSKPHEVCNGAEGKEGSFKGVIASGTVLKGTWAVNYNAAAKEENLPFAISTGVPIKGVPGQIPFMLVWSVGPLPLPGESQAIWELAKTECPGTAEAPLPITGTEYSGCLYVNPGSNTNIETFGANTIQDPESGGGVVMNEAFKSVAAGPAHAYGTWVIKAK